LKNNQYFHYRKLDYKIKEYYTRLTKVSKDRLDSNLVKIYLKKETTNIVEVDSKSNSF
jgi:hypothetical protein